MIKGFITGVVVANAFEWFAHKYVLHGVHRVGQSRYSPVPRSMKSHWEHHREVRKEVFSDYGYVEGLENWRVRNELLSLAVVGVVFSGLSYKVSKGFAFATWYSAVNYFYVHRKAHLEPEWAKRNIPWHYDHHMNSNQDANWCVTKPWFDYVMGTRVVSDLKLKEQNPIGIHLPHHVAALLSHNIQKFFPIKMAESKTNELKMPILVSSKKC